MHVERIVWSPWAAIASYMVQPMGASHSMHFSKVSQITVAIDMNLTTQEKQIILNVTEHSPWW